MTQERQKKKWYFISELNGAECARIEEGWGAVRALIDAGGRPRFRQTSCRERAEELRDGALLARARRDGGFYVRERARSGRIHGPGITGSQVA